MSTSLVIFSDYSNLVPILFTDLILKDKLRLVDTSVLSDKVLSYNVQDDERIFDRAFRIRHNRSYVWPSKSLFL